MTAAEPLYIFRSYFVESMTAAEPLYIVAFLIFGELDRGGAALYFCLLNFWRA